MEPVQPAPIKLSQNEIDHILANELNKWRKFRLQQVRAQSKEEAKALLDQAIEEEKKQRGKVKNEIKGKYEMEKQKKLEELENKYVKGLREIGEGHRRAEIENSALHFYEEKKKNNYKVAAKRGQQALLALDKEKSLLKERHNVSKLRKKNVIEKERKRSTKVSKLPTPVKFKTQKKLPSVPPKKVIFHEAGTFMTSSYVPSKVKIQKEEDLEEFSAKELAKREREKYEELEHIRKKQEEEIVRKIEERGKEATRRERTKKMYYDLMKDLKEAEENHELSDYLKGEESSDSQYADINLRRKLEEDTAREKASRIIKKQMEDLDNIPIKLETKFSDMKDESAIQKSLKLNVHETDAENGANLDEIDDRQGQVEAPPHLQSKNIHLKETVPVHEIPIVKEKFLVRVPLSEQSSRSSATSSSSERSKSTSSGNTDSQSSFEELKIKVTVNPPISQSVSDESLSSEEKAKSIDSGSTIYKSLPYVGKTKSIPKENNNTKYTTSLSSSSGATEYFEPPTTITDSEFRNQKMWDIIKDIQERRKRNEKLINELRKETRLLPSDSKTSDLKKELSSFKTPPTIYTESLKDDGSGERPISNRQKFEFQKKKILSHYMRRLLHIKEKELGQISASTVEGSGISLSSSGSILLDLLKSIDSISSTDLSLSTTPTITSDLFNKISDIDIVPSKFSSTPISSTSDSITSEQGLVSASSVRGSDVTPSQNGSLKVPSELDSEVKKQLYLRLLYLQQWKQQLLKKIKENQDVSQPSGKGKEENDLRTKSRMEKEESGLSGSSLELSSNNYETPPREVSTQTWSSFSSLEQERQGEVTDGLTQIEKDKKSAKFKEYKDFTKSLLDISNSSKSDANRQLHSLEEEIQTLTKSVQKLNTTLNRDESSVDERSETSKSASDPSSSSSIPDMAQVLQRFGLDWACSMISKMDKAEEIKSSDSSE